MFSLLPQHLRRIQVSMPYWFLLVGRWTHLLWYIEFYMSYTHTSLTDMYQGTAQTHTLTHIHKPRPQTCTKLLHKHTPHTFTPLIFTHWCHSASTDTFTHTHTITHTHTQTLHIHTYTHLTHSYTHTHCTNIHTSHIHTHTLIHTLMLHTPHTFAHTNVTAHLTHSHTHTLIHILMLLHTSHIQHTHTHTHTLMPLHTYTITHTHTHVSLVIVSVWLQIWMSVPCTMVAVLKTALTLLVLTTALATLLVMCWCEIVWLAGSQVSLQYLANLLILGMSRGERLWMFKA